MEHTELDEVECEGGAPREPARPGAVGEAEWIRQHQLGLWRYLRLLGCPADLAPDIMQDALLAAIDAALPRTRPGAVAARWLRTTARHLFHSQLRRSSRRPAIPLLAEHEAEAAWQIYAGTGNGDGGEYLTALRSCLAGLDPRHRDALALRYRDGASRESMAAALGIRAAGVKSLLRRLRTILRACVENRVDGGAIREGTREESKRRT